VLGQLQFDFQPLSLEISMAAAQLTNNDVAVIPLEEVSLAGLELLFDEQCDEWLALLDWDYTGPSRMIREVARQRELSGFAATSGSRTVGFAYYVVEPARCSIGDIYVSKQWRGLGADALMAKAIIKEIDGLKRPRRIESQCVTVGNTAASDVFSARGFTRFDRDYMVCDLSEASRNAYYVTADRRASDRLIDVSIRSWREEDFTQAARVIHRSYVGRHDSRINSQYATEEGCAELLSILTDHLWCGDFLPQVSRVAVRPSTGSVVGVLVASRLATLAGHISQISIHPALQGKGLGRWMISDALAEFGDLGLESASLAVTTANASAYHLYQSCGFRPVHSFPVFYRERI
jgi:ribosomal protein S18 acetylase RimI-like enzyme